MKVYDLAQKLYPGPAQFPGDPPVHIEAIKTIDEDGYQLELFSAGSHAGTHVDLPRHLFLSGKTVDEVPAEAFVGRAQVLRGAGGIGPEELARMPQLEVILLASSSEIWLTEEGAAFLAGKVKGVGTQSASIDPLDSTELPAHKCLLGAGIWIAENLNLAAAPKTEFLYIGPPVVLCGAGAAWARPVGIVPFPFK